MNIATSAPPRADSLPQPGLGVPCREVQCDGVPCPDVKVDCEHCDKAVASRAPGTTRRADKN